MDKLVLGLLAKILRKISPDVREFIVSSIKELDKKAKATPNPYDDVALDVLAWLLQVDFPENE